MNSQYDNTLATVVSTIRTAIDEDWIHDWDIHAETRLSSDLELDSIEFVKIADALQVHYGARINMVQWLSGKNMDELINMTVGDIAAFIASAAS
ncbi:MAG TPA: acyl carrier protein [Burkholderiaceae bacterium]